MELMDLQVQQDLGAQDQLAQPVPQMGQQDHRDRKVQLALQAAMAQPARQAQLDQPARLVGLVRKELLDKLRTETRAPLQYLAAEQTGPLTTAL